LHYVLTEFGDRVGAEFAQWFLGLVWKSQVSADGAEEGDAAAVVVEYWLKDLAYSCGGRRVLEAGAQQGAGVVAGGCAAPAFPVEDANLLTGQIGAKSFGRLV
jgi:hypothetical protein